MFSVWMLGNFMDAVFMIWYFRFDKERHNKIIFDSFEILRSTLDDMPMTVLTMWFVLEEYLMREEQSVDLQYFILFGYQIISTLFTIYAI